MLRGAPWQSTEKLWPSPRPPSASAWREQLSDPLEATQGGRMQINITGHHVDVTKALRDYVSTKFARLERHFDNVVNVHVVLTLEKLEQKAEASIRLSGGHLFADARSEEHTSELQSRENLVCRLLLEKKKKKKQQLTSRMR